MAIRVREPDGEALVVVPDGLEVVGFGRNAYLWVGDAEGRCVRIVQGQDLKDLQCAIRRALESTAPRRVNRQIRWPGEKQEVPKDG